MRNVQVNHQMITNHFYLDFTWCHKWSKNQLFTVTVETEAGTKMCGWKG